MGDEANGDAAFDAIERALAVRSYTDRTVPPRVVERLIRAACAAPSPRNLQPWEFVVASDEEVRTRLGEAFAPRVAQLEATIADMVDGPERRLFAAGARLARSIGEAPVVVFVCGRPLDMPPPHDPDEVLLSALFSAAQNLRIAARAMGLGSAFTNLHVHAEARVREILGIPNEVRIAATIPLGWPARPQGRARRRPVEDVLHWDTW